MTVAITELLVPGPARALAGLLGRSSENIDDGFALPPCWHWVYLLERPAHDELGPEGHPLHGIPEPPAPGLRRMFAGGRVTTYRPLRLGVEATRTVELADSRIRDGRSGRLTFVTTRATIEQSGELALVDEQDIVYREPTPLAAGPVEREAAPVEVTHRVEVDAALLFQFSALTYNAHRIHYDVDHCRDVEGYADLVVHGPLQALLMSELAQTHGGDDAGERFGYRLVAALTRGQGLEVTAAREQDTVVTTVRDASGRVTARGRRW